MHRARTCVAVLLLTLAAAAAWATPAGEHRPTPTVVSGVYAVTFNLNITSTLPAGATITCKAQIVPAQSLLESLNRQSAVTPVETASGMAIVTGSTATCAVEIPFSWTVNNPKVGVALSYEIDAFNASGALPAVVRSSVQEGIAESFPASGATASVSLNATF